MTIGGGDVLHRGNPVSSCEGWTRREWLRVGGLGTLGLGLPDLIRARALAEGSGPAANRPPGFGRARSCILLFMFGAPAHQDIWDLKPEAPDGVRGEFRPIATTSPTSASASTSPASPAWPIAWR